MSSSAVSIDPKTASLWARHYPGHDFIGTRTFGFWLYMLTDAMVYAALFASLVVLSHASNMIGGPTPKNFINPIYAYGETIALFASVLTYGLAMVNLKKGSRSGVTGWILLSAILGVVYLGLSITDNTHLFQQGITPQTNGFLSAFFAIVIYHALHIVVGVAWMLVMLIQIATEGFSQNVVYRLINLRLFWHFQAVIWVFVFVFVYLQGLLV
ncbi:cytochrome c oxidase subunit 3 [Acidithiobacillus sp. AMEEHan]|uniref:cytochrome c oxidase subunit 3 n=1 Tax=Acidithiobacillus sp. AMEEHan TaxID=2994951 RepID=UPI0027E42536|nr:cytochrome c oxidase subunit 3 [Acidithiobacillus sp. AMEEHan]